MKFFVALLVGMGIAGTIYAQEISSGTQTMAFREIYQESFQSVQQDAPDAPYEAMTSGNGKKSRFLGVVYSLLLPGMGELYANRFERGQIHLVAEGLLWLGFAGCSAYSGWVKDGATSFAEVHAGANFSGKDDDFRVHVENFKDVYAYNNYRLVEYDLASMYSANPEDGYFWSWDTDANREIFEQLRIKSDVISNATSFIILGMVANRIWSAIRASLAVRDYNSQLQERAYTLPYITTQVTSIQGKPEGLRLQIVQPF